MQQGLQYLGLCVCLSVTTLGATAFVHPPKLRRHRDNYLSCFLGYMLMDFAKKVLLKRYGVICLPWLALTFSVHRIHKQMFFKTSTATALRNDITNKSSNSQKVTVLSLAFTVHVVIWLAHAHVLTRYTQGSNI